MLPYLSHHTPSLPLTLLFYPKELVLYSSKIGQRAPLTSKQSKVGTRLGGGVSRQHLSSPTPPAGQADHSTSNSVDDNACGVSDSSPQSRLEHHPVDEDYELFKLPPRPGTGKSLGCPTNRGVPGVPVRKPQVRGRIPKVAPSLLRSLPLGAPGVRRLAGAVPALEGQAARPVRAERRWRQLR